jgi:hypothetical protein
MDDERDSVGHRGVGHAGTLATYCY